MKALLVNGFILIVCLVVTSSLNLNCFTETEATETGGGFSIKPYMIERSFVEKNIVDFAFRWRFKEDSTVTTEIAHTEMLKKTFWYSHPAQIDTQLVIVIYYEGKGRQPVNREEYRYNRKIGPITGIFDEHLFQFIKTNTIIKIDREKGVYPEILAKMHLIQDVRTVICTRDNTLCVGAGRLINSNSNFYSEPAFVIEYDDILINSRNSPERDLNPFSPQSQVYEKEYRLLVL